MDSRTYRHRQAHRSTRSRGVILVVIIILLVVIELIVVQLVVSGTRDHDLTIRRSQTIEAFYAAEAGTNMAIREMLNDIDEDSDGTTGTISDDGNAANDPSIGGAQVFVTKDVNGSQTTLMTHGRSGEAQRDATTLLVSGGATGSSTIETVAGIGGVEGYSGDGGPATSATMRQCRGIAVQSDGTIYIGDLDNFAIRKVDTSGTITTICGNGIQGDTGDGGPAAAATLGKPKGLTVDAAGNVYVCSTSYSRIRKIDAGTGIITTIAGTGSGGYTGDGGLATAAKINKPEGVALDAAGNIYIADSKNNVVRKIDAGTGIITTIAGTGQLGDLGDGGPATSAKLNFPKKVAVDTAGNVYIADTNNDRVRVVSAATGIISAFAGTGAFGDTGDTGSATLAQLWEPIGLAIDAAGDVYIADSKNNRVRKVVTATGIIDAFAGTGTSGSTGDGGPAIDATLNGMQALDFDGAGNLYIADSKNSTIRRVGSGTGTRISGWQEIAPN